MSTPSVIEITRRPEPVVHDTFIDDLPAYFVAQGRIRTEDARPAGRLGVSGGRPR